MKDFKGFIIFIILKIYFPEQYFYLEKQKLSLDFI